MKKKLEGFISSENWI